MKLVTLAAVMMVSGMGWGQAGKAANKPTIYASEGQEVLHSNSNKIVSVRKGGYPDGPFDFNSPGPIKWRDPYYVKYASGWMCSRELVEKRDTICFRMLQSFHWEWWDCTKESQVCRDIKEGKK